MDLTTYPDRESTSLKRKRQPSKAAVVLFGTKIYFAATAFRRALRRDLYLAAVFLWIVPF